MEKNKEYFHAVSGKSENILQEELRREIEQQKAFFQMQQLSLKGDR